MATIYFTKRFDSGLLKGCHVTSNISFPADRTPYYVRQFAVGVKGKDCITKDRWTITDASFQNYAR